VPVLFEEAQVARETIASASESGDVGGGKGEPTLADVKRRFRARLPREADADGLADAWSRAVLQQAINANLSAGAPPNTLAAFRADLLMHVCRELKRLVSEREAEVLLRLSPTAARATHRLMKATYEDALYDFILDWALRDASSDGKGEFDGVRGDRVTFGSKDALDAATAELKRAGWRIARKRDEENKPFLLYVEKASGVGSRLSSRGS
jgi:hypothetical protein